MKNAVYQVTFAQPAIGDSNKKTTELVKVYTVARHVNDAIAKAYRHDKVGSKAVPYEVIRGQEIDVR